MRQLAATLACSLALAAAEPSKVGVSASGAVSDAAQPVDDFLGNITHFTDLDQAASFLEGSAPGAARALGFFSGVNTAEHDVFLTVARELSLEPEFAPQLGRATVKRGSTGCTFNLVPGARLRGAALSANTPLLTHQFRLPAPDDEAEVPRRWRALPAEARSGGDGEPPLRKMWERVLEEEALRLHRWLQAGAIPPLSLLTPTSVEPLLRATDALGLLLLPPGANDALRTYYTRRVRAVAAGFPPVRCAAVGERPAAEKTGDDALGSLELEQVWLSELPRCEPAPPAERLHFAHADSDAESIARLSVHTHLPKLLGVPRRGDARFVLLRRGAGSAAGWAMRELEGAVSQQAVDALCRHETLVPWAGGAATSGAWSGGAPPPSE